MAQGVVVDVSARITGYEQSLAHLKNALSKLDPGSSLARSLSKGLAAAESQIKSLGKNLSPKFTSESQLDKFVDKINNIGTSIVLMGRKLQEATNIDLNFSAIKGFDELTKKIAELESSLNTAYYNAFKEAVVSSEELNESLKSFGIDMTQTKTIEEVLAALTQKINETTKATEEFQQEYNKAFANQQRISTRIESLKGTIFGNVESAETSTKKVHDIADDFLKIGNLRERIIQKLQEQFSNKEDLQKIIDKFFDGLDGTTAKKKIEELMSSLSVKEKKQEFYENIFGANKLNTGRNIDSLVNWLGLPKTEEVKAELLKYTEQLASAPKGISANARTKILGFLTSDEIDKAVEELLKAISAAYKRVQEQIFKENNNLLVATNATDTAKAALDSSTAKGKSLAQVENTAKNISESVKEVSTTGVEVRVLSGELQQANDELSDMKEKGASGLHEVGKAAEDTGEKLHIGVNEVQKYNDALEKVHEREQLVGKIEGIVQRWFSIYAAVRMVSNALRSIISTIKELDKTITDITIVTNMSREDLWGQMPTYTKMAQDYAVSISGVYQVSQLFYQQGLQTNDVLTLTGETLKMARIAGLDYGEATNYMTNALRSFKMEMDEASRVTDVYSVLAASAAVSVSEIAEAMSKTASSAYAVGASLENTATMITVMTEATRESATNIGSALKSIISRYGEMTSDPAKLVDSEGEEMSLNKVDRALQSVGITLQDAQGQFRNFDDVIAELAATWNTLDNNTQRYIATVMAGNRQQSRFLALVSSYDRYAELSEKAANAAGAGQEQFEKTLEGIEARTQQLQTSLQNLYTSAGLQDLYGALLGIGSNVLEYYNNISAAFGSGISGAAAAVATFGAQFYNLANVVTNVVKLVKNHYIASQKELTILTQAEEELRQQGKISSETESALKTVRIWKNAYKEITSAAKQEAENASQAEVNAASKAVRRSKIGNVAYGLGTAGSLVGTMIGGQTGNIVSSTSGVIGAIGAFASHNWLGGIMSLISAGTSFISLLSGANEVVNKYTESLERNQKAQEEYGKAQQKSAQSKALVTTIENEIDKLNELSIAQYDSTESKQAYLEQVNKLADAYPELIDHYTDEGNAILISKEQLQKYIELKKEQQRLDREDELRKRLDVNYEDIAAAKRVEKYTIETKADTDEAIKTAYENALYDIVHEGQITAAESQGSFRVFSFIDKNLYPILSQLQEFSANLREATGYFGDADARSIYGISGTLDHDRDANRLDYWSPYTGTYYADEDAWEALVLESIKKAETAGTSIVTAFDEAIIRAVGEENYVKSRSIYRSVLVALEAEQAKEGKISENKDVREQIAKDWIENSSIYTTSLEKIAASASLSGGFENYLTDKQKQYGAQFKEHPISEFWDEYLQQWQYDTTEYYGRASKEEIEKLNNAFDNLEDYSLNRIRQLYDPLEQSQATQKLTSKFNTQLDSIRDNFDKAAKIKVNDQQVNAFTAEQQKTIDAWFDNYSLNFLRIITSTLPAIRNASNENREFVTNQWIEFYDSLSNLNEKDLFTVGRNIQKYDLTSISGIFAVIDEISNIQGTEAAQEKLKALAEYIVPNFIVELDSMTDVLTSNFEQLTKTISDAQKGMNLSDAIKMADTLGISITEFQQVGNQYYYTDYMALVDKYLGSQEEIAKYLFGQFDVNTDKKDELEAYERAVAARNQYYNYAREAYLAEGRIADFLSSFAGDRDIDVDEVAIRAMLAAGEIPEGLEEYSTQLIQWYQSLGDDVYQIFMDSLSSGEFTEVKVTASNKDLLQQYDKFVKGEIIEGNNVLVNLAQATAEELQEFYNGILRNGTISPKERNSYLKTLDDEIISRDKANVLKEVTNSYASFDRALATRYAEAFGLSIDELDFNETTRTLSVTLAQLQEQLNKVISEGADAETVAELQDAIRSIRKDIGNLITSGLKGTLTNAEKFNLIDLTQSWNIDLTFQETNKGLQLSRDSAIALYAELLKIDSVAANIVFTNLKEQFTEVGEACENISSTMSSIARLEQEIKSNTNGTNKELENRLDIYKRIAAEQMNDPNSYQFMNRSLPNGMQSPINYWESAYSMRETMIAAAENGNIGVQDFYNIVNEMNYWASLGAENISFMGENLDGSMTSAAALIEKGMRALKVVDGKTVVDFESFGINFANGADEMATGVDSGIKEFANSQIKILDGLINYLETIVAMEQLSKTGEIDWTVPLFGKDGKINEKGREAADQLMQIATQTKEDGKTLTDTAASIQSYLKSFDVGEGYTLWDVLMSIANPDDATQWSEEVVAAVEAARANIAKYVNDDKYSLENVAEREKENRKITEQKIPQQQLDLVLNFSGNGKIEDAEKFASMVQQFLEIDGTGNITIQGESADATFTLDIQNNGATAMLTWSNGTSAEYDLATNGDLYNWLTEEANKYAKANNLTDLAPIKLTTQKVSVNNKDSETNIEISINYTNDQKNAGTVMIGEFTEEFGPNSTYKSAAEALSIVAQDYNNRYGSGTLQDITFPVKNITVTSANDVTYNFKVNPGETDISTIQDDWNKVKSNIDTFIAAIDNPESAGVQFDIDTTQPDWVVTVNSINVTGTKIIKYNFKVQSQTLNNKVRLENQWQQVKNHIAQLTELTSHVPEGTVINAVDDGENGYTVQIDATDISGTKAIRYAFDIDSDISNNQIELTKKWAQVAQNIATLRRNAQNMPRIFNKLAVQESEGQYRISFDDINIGGESTIVYDVQIGDTNNGLSTTEFANACVTAKANIEKYKEAYKDLMDAAGIKKLGILQYQDSSLQLSANIYVGDGVSITWSSAKIAGNSDEVIQDIKDAKTSLDNWKAEVESLNNTASEILTVTPAPIEVDNSIHLKIVDDKVYFDNGELAGTPFDSVEAALNGLKNSKVKKQSQIQLSSSEWFDKYWSEIRPDGNIDKAITYHGLGTFAASREQNTSIDLAEWAEKHFNNIDQAKQYFKDIGVEIDEGVLSGIMSGDSSAASQELIDEIEAAMKSYAGINSPAEKFIPIGQYIAEGIGEGILQGDLAPYIQQLVENGLDAKFALPRADSGFGNFNAGAKNSVQAATLVAIRQMTDASDANVDATNSISDNLSSITSALDSNVSAIQSILPAIPEEPNAADWYSVFDGISVHGDFWGEGNQIVLSDGKGGNLHYKMTDYITIINDVIKNAQEYSSENPINLAINADTTSAFSVVKAFINSANKMVATVKIGADTATGGIGAGISTLRDILFRKGAAKGNVALGKGTLMGELGAELYVTGGHYYIAGQNGAEFVDLPDDAIVFNHLQTKRLLGTGSAGRGRAVTNEKKATSYATGNVAMASASDTLAVLKNIKAMWEQLANLSFKDLATKGGGSGGGGGKEGLDKGFIADLERWYNLLRQIDKLEKDINYEEKLRSKIQSDRVINGAAIYESQKRSLEMLEQEISAHRELATLQESYYDLRRKEFEQTGYSRIFKFTEQGLMQYNDEDVAKDSNLVGLFSLARLNALDANNQPVYTSKQQYDMLQEMGFGSDLLYTAEGEAIDVSEDDGYAKAVEAFWDKLEGWKDELDGLYDSYREQLDAILDNETERNKLMQEIVDNQRSVEDKVLEAIENREQATIDKLQEQTDALRDTSDRYIDGLNNQLNKERQMYQQQESQEDLRKLRRQLAILERSGGSGSQIANLRAQIAEQEQDQYFDAQQQQIDAIKEASDLQLERLDHQIEIMTETLAYQKENGLLWGEVYEVMARNPQEIVSFITEHSPEWSSQSTLAQSEELKELSNIVSQWSAYYKDKQEGKDVVDTGTSDFDWNSFAPKAAELYKQIWDENKETARKLFDATYKETGDPNAAWKAVTNYLNPLMSAYKTAHPEEFNPQILPVGTGDSSASSSGSTSKASTDDLYYYVNKNGQIMRATKSWASNNKMPESPVSKDYATVSNWLKNQSGHGWQVNYNGMTYRANTTDRTAAETLLMNQLLAAGLSSTERDRAMSTLKKYKQGGLNDYTGLAMLHGTKTRPEGILNAEQTRVLRKDILSNKPDSLLSQLQFLHDLWTNTATSSGALNNNNNIIIEKAEVNMNVDSIANDYDAQRAGEQALEQMLAIARKTSVQNLRR